MGTKEKKLRLRRAVHDGWCFVLAILVQQHLRVNLRLGQWMEVYCILARMFFLLRETPKAEDLSGLICVREFTFLKNTS